ncbi:MAG: TetR family transcriptional regulator [Nitratireductor sp.]
MANPKTRQRDATKTRENIIIVAQRHFTAKGFDACGVREIAAEAGVDPALINRYFGSKTGLFEEAVINEITVEALLEGDKESFGKRIAGIMVNKDMSGQALDPTAVVANSIASPTVGAMLARMMEERLIPQIASWLGGRYPEQRAALIVSTLLGYEILGRLAKLGSLKHPNSEAVTEKFARSLQLYVDDK